MVKRVRVALFQEVVAEINNKSTLLLTTSKKLSKKENVEANIVGLFINELETALELLNKLNDHLK